MGTSSMGNTRESDLEYTILVREEKSIIGEPNIVRSGKTGIELEQYMIQNNELSIDQNIRLYKLRSSSYSKNIAVVHTHDLVREKDATFLVRTEKMHGRLSLIHDLTYLEALVVLEGAYGGYAELYFHVKRPFIITPHMIAVNSIPLVRVWVNDIFAMNKINPIHGNQNTIIEQIYNVVLDHVASAERRKIQNLRNVLLHQNRIIGAKNAITPLLNGMNRKAILSDLIKRQIQKEKLKEIKEEKKKISSSGVQHSNGQVNILESRAKISILNPQKHKKLVSDFPAEQGTPTRKFNHSHKKMNMVSKKSIFKRSQIKTQSNIEEQSRFVQDKSLKFSPIKITAHQKQNMTANNETKSKLNRSGIKVESSIHSLQKKKSEDESQMQRSKMKRNHPGVHIKITPSSTKNATGNRKGEVLSIKSFKMQAQTPKAKPRIYKEHMVDRQDTKLKKSQVTDSHPYRFNYFQRNTETMNERVRPQDSDMMSPTNPPSETSKTIHLPNWQKYSSISHHRQHNQLMYLNRNQINYH